MAKGRRSKNGKSNLSKSSDQRDKLSTTLKPFGLSIKPISGDGNCLFRAFANQYCGDEGRYDEFRQECCSYMLEEEPEFFSGFLDDSSIQDYVDNMRQDGTWGTQMEIVSLCRKYSVNCVIFRPDGLHYRIESLPDSDSRILMLSHHDDEHFNEVCFKEKGRVLESFNELELLLTDLAPTPDPPRVSKKDARLSRRQKAPQVSLSVSPDPIQKLIDI